MNKKRMRMLQIIALVLAGIAIILCTLVVISPRLFGISGIDEIRIIPTSAFIHSVGYMAVGLVYYVALGHRATGKTQAVVVFNAVLLCILTVIIEPIVHNTESLQIQTLVQNGYDSNAVSIFIAVKQGLRELIRMILYVSGALTFLSMGYFFAGISPEEQSES